ncbi:aquaporin [Streptomyces niveiscabiei]|uniref:Aquaporin n=1 Tax=Streptomyces niveiscabiei TaxID=164115 RepID=A0ABW9HU72_9ACTN
MNASLGRRAPAEAVGTAALVAVVVGSGIQATELTDDVGVQLLANSLATVFGLGVLIVLFGPVSGAHFNPAVTLAVWFADRRTPGGPTPRDLAAYVSAQAAGAVAGAVLADAMFAEPLVRWSSHDRSAGHLLLGELVATAGLVLLVLGLAGDRVQVRSAGSAPAGTVNPAVVEALAEAGIDISAEVPKVLTTEAVQASDVVITMGCGDTCPVFPGKRYLDWQLPDPAGQGVDAVRPIRDEIEKRVRDLIAEIAPGD